MGEDRKIFEKVFEKSCIKLGEMNEGGVGRYLFVLGKFFGKFYLEFRLFKRDNEMVCYIFMRSRNVWFIEKIFFRIEEYFREVFEKFFEVRKVLEMGDKFEFLFLWMVIMKYGFIDR